MTLLNPTTPISPPRHSQPTIRALGAGSSSNIASTVTISDLFPTGRASNSLLGSPTSSGASGTITGSGNGGGIAANGGEGGQNLYLIIFLSILSLLLLTSTFIAIRAIALRRRYRSRIQLALARGELPPFTNVNTGHPGGGGGFDDPNGSDGLPRWMQWLFGTSHGGGSYYGNGSDENPFVSTGMIDPRRGQRGSRTGERERLRRERRNMEVPRMWEAVMEDEEGQDEELLGGDGKKEGSDKWTGDWGMKHDLKNMKPLSLIPLVNIPAPPPLSSSSHPMPPMPQSSPANSLPPPLFTLAPLTQSISRLTRFSTNGSGTGTQGGGAGNDESLGGMDRDRERRRAGIDDVLHEVPGENGSRNPSRRGSISTGGVEPIANSTTQAHSQEEAISDNQNQNDLDITSPERRSGRNSLTRMGRGGFGNIMSSRPAPPIPPITQDESIGRDSAPAGINIVNARGTAVGGESSTPRAITRTPTQGESVFVGFVIRMPDRRDQRGQAQIQDEEESHSAMELGVLEGTIGENQDSADRWGEFADRPRGRRKESVDV